MMTGYYSHHYVSNSDLSKLARDLSPADAVEYANAYRLGTLLDAIVTSPHDVDYLKRTVGQYSYTEDEINTARKMRASFMGDTLAPLLFKHSEFQKEFYVPGVPFTYNGITYTLDCRCRYDGYSSTLGYGWDLKSTTARTLSQFESACQRFSYYRQAYWYMRLAGAKQMIIIGVSKSLPHSVFKIFIREGDAKWKAGEAEALDLSFKYYALKPSIEAV